MVFYGLNREAGAGAKVRPFVEEGCTTEEET